MAISVGNLVATILNENYILRFILSRTIAKIRKEKWTKKKWKWWNTHTHTQRARRKWMNCSFQQIYCCRKRRMQLQDYDWKKNQQRNYEIRLMCGVGNMHRCDKNRTHLYYTNENCATIAKLSGLFQFVKRSQHMGEINKCYLLSSLPILFHFTVVLNITYY